jgi:hypothetical protein
MVVSCWSSSIIILAMHGHMNAEYLSILSHNGPHLRTVLLDSLLAKCVSVVPDDTRRCYNRYTNEDVSYEAYVNWSLSNTSEIRL